MCKDDILQSIKEIYLADITCTHCNLTFPEEVMIAEQQDDKQLFFCCKGCQGVYHLLNSEGLDTFYDKLGDTKLQPAKMLQGKPNLPHQAYHDYQQFKILATSIVG